VARRTQAGHTLEEMQEAGDKLADWMNDHALLLLGGALAFLLVAGLAIFLIGRSEGAEETAAEALANAQNSYRTAMGAAPGDVSVPEPANPETARRIRGEYIERFRQVAEQNPGTTAGALAQLSMGGLELELGDREQAVETWRAAESALSPEDPVRAFFLRRIAGARETEAAWLEAAQAYEAAAGIEAYPLRWAALADAARCYAEAGDSAAAIAAFERLQSQAPDYRPPAYVSARIRELEVTRQAMATGTTPAESTP